MKKWTRILNTHLNYSEETVLKETKTRYLFWFGYKPKSECYEREVEVINAIIADKAYELQLYDTLRKQRLKEIDMLLERKHNI